jgi:hypothetical protein
LTKNKDMVGKKVGDTLPTGPGVLYSGAISANFARAMSLKSSLLAG